MHNHTFNVGFQTLTEEERIVLCSFREGELHLPYKATENFLTRQQTYEALRSLTQKGIVSLGAPYKLTRRGSQLFSVYYSNHEF